MKTQISAKVIADSVGADNGIRLTTLELEYPRFIHSEFMTHRVFSRNASSSRAIPVEKMIERVSSDPAMPVEWGSNQPGMQAGAEVDDIRAATESWRYAAYDAVLWAKVLNTRGLHKQIVNRVLEPFSWIKVLVTATEWHNFFELRDHPDAQPEIRVLAIAMREAMADSEPEALRFDEWHLPYVTDNENVNAAHDLRRISAARCARVSYLNHDQSAPSVTKDLALFYRLVGGRPLHASPLEHQAIPDYNPVFTRNFRGWIQHRAIHEAAQ